MKHIILLLLLTISISSVKAETIYCPNMNILYVYVEGSRDDNFELQNKLVIFFLQECAEKRWTHTNIDSPAMSSFLAVALSARANDFGRVSIAVNTSDQTSLSNDLAFIGKGR